MSAAAPARVLGNLEFTRQTLRPANPELVVSPDGQIANTASLADAFQAVRHEHRVTLQTPMLREEDSMKPVVGSDTGERYSGAPGRLLRFKNTR